jgi:NodT family efflux transporter outer membrane factor (OMF) lipoprotein
MRLFLPVILIFLALTACSLAPKYERPDLLVPFAYKEAGKWVPASPTYATTDRGHWWEVYGDPKLNVLEEKVGRANQNLKIALARYQEARAKAAIARADFFPVITGVSNVQRDKYSANISNAPPVLQFNDMLLGADFSYEIDVWGRIRNQAAAAANLANASAADLASIDLSLHAELATDYFSLRGDDETQRALDATVIAYQKAYAVTKDRYDGGVAPIGDVDQAKAQLESARSLATDIRLKRAQLEHAIAVLIGEPPAEFALLPTKQKVKVISIAPSMPSLLLQRRPDIAAAELRVQAANATIGVARAAYFPDFSLLGSVGIESAVGYNLFRAPSLFWSLGPSAAVILFDGGKISAFVDLAKAQYFETVANYRQTTLTAFQEVEDSLVAIHQLNSEVKTQAAAAKAAYSALDQSRYRYVGGIVNYLDVVLSQNIALQAELLDVDVRTRRQIASVQLIKALGGGWQDLRY